MAREVGVPTITRTTLFRELVINHVRFHLAVRKGTLVDGVRKGLCDLHEVARLFYRSPKNEACQAPVNRRLKHPAESLRVHDHRRYGRLIDTLLALQQEGRTNEEEVRLIASGKAGIASGEKSVIEVKGVQ